MSAMEDKITSLSAEGKMFQPPEKGRDQAWVKSMAEYKQAYARSMDDPEGFWAERAEQLITWDKKWDKVLECDFTTPRSNGSQGGKLNISDNCLDRHLTNGRRNKAAIIWQGEPEEDVRVYTYQMLHTEVCRFANVLKKKGREKRRPGCHLPADDPGTGHLAAGLRPDRRHPFRGLCRFLRHCPAEPHPGLRGQGADHRRCRSARRQDHSAEAQRRRRPGELPHVKNCIVVRRAGNEIADEGGPRLLVARGGYRSGYLQRLSA